MIAATRVEGAETAPVFHIAGVDETVRRLDEVGFGDVQAWLEPHHVEFRTRDEMLDDIVVPYLRPALGWSEDELYALASAVADRLGVLAIDYVRLNATARRR